MDATLLAMATQAHALQATKLGGWVCRASTPTDAGSFASSVLSSTMTSMTSSCGSDRESGGEDEMTSLILRNIPNSYTRPLLLELLNSHGFDGLYNFVYLPMDFNTGVGLGYAFVNFVDHASAQSFFEKLRGFRNWPTFSGKVLEVDWSAGHQGLSSHIERYRNSPVMHESVADEFRPMLFKDGTRKAFPQPTRKLRAPRSRTERK